MTSSTMIRTHPRSSAVDATLLAEAIDAALRCSQTCTACADACLAEPAVADLDCADVCAATARVLSRLTEPDDALVRTLLQACVAACRTCGEECASHASQHDHCRVCAEACRACAEACQGLLDALG